MEWFWKIWAVRSPEGTTIALKLPRSWKRERDTRAPIAFLNARDGSLFQITPFPRAESALLHGKLRDAIVARAMELRKKSIGEQVEVFGVGGGDIEGWYFISSDRNVKPGEWAHAIFGMIELNNIVMSFTILSHHPLRMGEGDALRSFSYLAVKNR